MKIVSSERRFVSRVAIGLFVIIAGATVASPMSAQQLVAPHGVTSASRNAATVSARDRDATVPKKSPAKPTVVGAIAGALVGSAIGYSQREYITCPNGPDTTCSAGVRRNTMVGAVSGALFGAIGGALYSQLR